MLDRIEQTIVSQREYHVLKRNATFPLHPFVLGIIPVKQCPDAYTALCVRFGNIRI